MPCLQILCAGPQTWVAGDPSDELQHRQERPRLLAKAVMTVVAEQWEAAVTGVQLPECGKVQALRRDLNRINLSSNGPMFQTAKARSQGREWAGGDVNCRQQNVIIKGDIWTFFLPTTYWLACRSCHNVSVLCSINQWMEDSCSI